MASRGAAGGAAAGKESPAARGKEVLRRLRKAYPDARCALDHGSDLELLVATILSAQCTDERVNKVTPALFARYPDARAYAEADPEELETMIKSTGFFRAKSRSLMGLGRELVARHGGRVPAAMEQLVELPGVGRKTANVLLGVFHGVPSIAVDTHVTRVAGRLGLTRSSDPVEIEQDLWSVFPRKDWTLSSTLLIIHGRRTCAARKPACERCPLLELCPAAPAFLPVARKGGRARRGLMR